LAETVEQVAFGESVRALDDQTETLRTLRSSAGIVLGANSLIMAAMGRFGGSEAESLYIRLVPLLLMIVSGTLCISILWPTFGLTARFSATTFLSNVPAGHSVPVSAVHRQLALYVDRHVQDNVPKVAQLVSQLRWAAVFLLISVSVWILLLLAGVR
jgi:hypothetical protein